VWQGVAGRAACGGAGRLLLEELDVCVEKVALGDVDALAAQLEDELKDARGDGSLARGRRVREDACQHLVLQHEPVQLGHIQVVGRRAGRHRVAEAFAFHDGGDGLEADVLDVLPHLVPRHASHLLVHPLDPELLERLLGRG